jgi:hypothetical protein
VQQPSSSSSPTLIEFAFALLLLLFGAAWVCATVYGGLGAFVLDSMSRFGPIGLHSLG